MKVPESIYCYFGFAALGLVLSGLKKLELSQIQKSLNTTKSQRKD